MKFSFSRLKFYPFGRRSVKAIVFFPNQYGASIVQGPQYEHGSSGSDVEDDTYQLTVLRASKPHPKGIYDSYAVFDTPVTDGEDRLEFQTREEIERALDEIAALGAQGQPRHVIVAVYGATHGTWFAQGALYGASTDIVRAENPLYWRHLRDEREPYALFLGERVPENLVRQVETQSTQDQYFSDGYVALDAIRPFLDREPLYESPVRQEREED
jgi:hypothetical protein